MARVLIAEPAEDIGPLFARYVERLDHVAVLYDARPLGELGPLDAALIEPAAGGLPLARRLRDVDPALPIVFVSIYAPSAATRAFDPVAHVMKPVARKDVERALEAALERRSGAV